MKIPRNMSRKTKIFVSLGPSSEKPELITAMLKAGADAFRLNFSHGSYEEKDSAIKMIRRAENITGKPVGIIADLRGPTVRIGELKEELLVKPGDRVSIVNAEKAVERNTIPLPLKVVYDVIEEGDTLLIDDGKIVLKARKVTDKNVVCEVLIGGLIKSRKTFVVRGRYIPLPALTEKDIADIEFSLERGVEFFALSFVRSERDITELRKALDERGAHDAKIIAKIETDVAVERIDKILEVTDYIMIARGDLAMYYPLEEIPRIQLLLAEKALNAGKPAILATQVLESMIDSPEPTRAEVDEVYSAVRQGVAGLLLANETTIGKYPLESVIWLDRILRAAEAFVKPTKPQEEEKRPLYDEFARGIVALAESLNGAILLYTEGGFTASRVSKYRPRVPAIAVTGSKRVARVIATYWGIYPVVLDERDPYRALQKALTILKKEGVFEKGDVVVVTVGVRENAIELGRVEII